MIRNKAVVNGENVRINADNLVTLLPKYNKERIYTANDAKKLAVELRALTEQVESAASKAKDTEILYRSFE